MKLEFISLDKLCVSKANMRHGRKAPNVSDLLPSIRKRGVIQPVIVRPSGSPETFEIIAGRRRFHAELIVADERRSAGEAETAMLPCAILEDGDDADALEASILENMARLDPDEVTRWESFTRLVKEGRTVEDIATTFALPDLAVRRILALGNLLPRIRDLYRREEIDASTVRHLTLASKSQQKSWLALADDPDGYAPTGHQLKSWLFGGQSIAARHALFDIEASGLATIADLFGEDRYFTDGDGFWTAQNQAVSMRRDAYLEAGWPDVVMISPHEHFSTWEYEKAGKRKGGRVYIVVRASGEIIFHEGYLSRKEAARIAKGECSAVAEKPTRPELTATLATYVDLHRHAATRARLLHFPQVALRLMAAHAICGSSLWTVRFEPQSTRNDDVRYSIDNSRAEAEFDTRRRAILALLDRPDDDSHVTRGYGSDYDQVRLFHRLLELPDTAVMEIIALVMGETLASGSTIIEAVALEIGIDMTAFWQADDAFFSLLRDRELLGKMVAEVAGDLVASANAGEKTKVLKGILRDHLEGNGGREAHGPWAPRWMAFPPAAYTARGGVPMVIAHARAVGARDRTEERDDDYADVSDGGIEAHAGEGSDVLDPDGTAVTPVEALGGEAEPVAEPPSEKPSLAA